MTFDVRRAAIDDAALVREIMRAAFAEYDGILNPPSGALLETLEDTASALALGGAVLAFEGVAAVGSARYELRNDHAYFGRLSVLPGYRGHGVGALMLSEMENIARDAGHTEGRLGVRMALPENLALYQRLGYEVTSIYGHPSDPTAMIADMAKPL